MLTLLHLVFYLSLTDISELIFYPYFTGTETEA